MATIIYLDVDDEITSAAARIRNAPETKVGLVLPAGSRLATSRINFRLLAREGLERNRVLSIVAADPAARSIAASAGLPVFATVAEYEAAIGPPRTPPPPAGPPSPGEAAPPATDDLPPASGSSVRSEGASARRRGRGAAAAAAGAAAASGAAAGTSSVVAQGAAGAAGPSSGAAAPTARPEQLSADLLAPTIAQSETVVAPPAWQPSPAAPELPPGPPEARARSGAATIAVVPAVRRRGVPSGLALALGGVLVAVLIVAAAAYLLLPQATVVLTPVAVPVGPVDFVVRADPDATTVDAAGGVIPATRLSQDFTASGQYPATGKRVVQTKAKGSVTFKNCDTGGGHRVPAGSVVSTSGGVEFATGSDVSLARATLNGTTVTCANGSTAVVAVLPGTRGNVAAGAITQIPPGFDPVVIKVSNPNPTSGGARQVFTRVQQADLDAAMADLTKDLQSQFATWVAAPPDLPQGATAYPATGKLGRPVPTVDPSTLLNLEEGTFQLGATATGTVVAVDTAQIDEVAAQRVSVNVPADHTLQDGSVAATHDKGQADGELIDFRVTANGAAIPVLDEAALRESIKGKSVDEARQILGRYGTVTIDTWPGFVSSIPSLDFRLDLTVNGANGAASPTPGPSGSAP